MQKIRIILIIQLLAFNSVFSQVAIGKQNISSESVSLEFGFGNKGLILPWVQNASLSNNDEPGTLLLATLDNICLAGYKDNTKWQSLNRQAGTIDTSLQDSETENNTAKVSIGQPSSVKGILVLEATNKAMILPKVASPHLNIIKPEPGTIAFDTVKQQLAVYSGTQWDFWN